MNTADETQLHKRCPIRTAMDTIGGKWRLLLLYQIASLDEVTFTALKNAIPDISDKMLAAELTHLCDQELIERFVSTAQAGKTCYRITPQGQLALPLIEALRDFGLKYTAMQMRIGS